MSGYTICKLVHLIGIFLLFMGVGGMIVRAKLSDKENKELNISNIKLELIKFLGSYFI